MKDSLTKSDALLLNRQSKKFIDDSILSTGYVNKHFYLKIYSFFSTSCLIICGRSILSAVLFWLSYS